MPSTRSCSNASQPSVGVAEPGLELQFQLITPDGERNVLFDREPEVDGDLHVGPVETDGVAAIILGCIQGRISTL